MGRKLSIGRAAAEAGVDRTTVGRWLKTGKLKSAGSATVRNLVAVLVDVDEVRALAKQITSGRPRLGK